MKIKPTAAFALAMALLPLAAAAAEPSPQCREIAARSGCKDGECLAAALKQPEGRALAGCIIGEVGGYLAQQEIERLGASK
jgi:hypothetical protein